MIELQNLQNTTVKIVPLVFGALGSLSDAIYTYLSLLQVANRCQSPPAAENCSFKDCGYSEKTSNSCKF